MGGAALLIEYIYRDDCAWHEYDWYVFKPISQGQIGCYYLF